MFCLLYGISAVGNRKHEAQKGTEETTDRLRTIVRGKNMVEPLDEEKLPTPDSMLNLEANHTIIAGNDESRGGLMTSAPFIICRNVSCNYVFPFSLDKCPKCKTEQYYIAPPTKESDDLDQDGIPDLFEKATDFLNYRYRGDACEDYDNDGFLNVEEYRAGTALDDPSSVPPLGYLLRRQGHARKLKLPFTLKRVKAFDSEKERWKANMQVAGTPRPADFKNGNEIGVGDQKFRITDINADKRTVTLEDSAGNKYSMGIDQQVEESQYRIEFAYLADHTRAALAQARRTPRNEAQMRRTPAEQAGEESQNKAERQRHRPRGRMAPGNDDIDAPSGDEAVQTLAFTLHTGRTFVLALTSPDDPENTRIEYYRVLEVENAGSEDDVVRIQQVTALDGGDPVNDPITVPVLDNSDKSVDFLEYGKDLQINDEGMGGRGPRGAPPRRGLR